MTHQGIIAALTTLVVLSIGAAHPAMAQQQGATPDRLLDTGRAVYEATCAHCHANAAGRVGTQVLKQRLGPEQSVLAERSDLHADYVRRVVRYGMNIMPAFRPTELSDAEIDALAVYLTRKNPVGR